MARRRAPWKQTITAANQIFLGTTQYAQASSVSVLNQDGSTSGALRGINIGTDGTITGQFTTGGTQPLLESLWLTSPVPKA